MFKKKKGKGGNNDAGAGAGADSAGAATLPGGIDPTSPEARRANNVKEISFDDLKLHFLVIKINRGIDLKAADMTLKGGNSDPFVEVIANKQKFSTKVIYESLNPEWNEETTFCFFELVKEIEFKVYDWDKGSKHDAIGNVFLDTSLFFNQNNNGFEGDLTLTNVKKGKINVSVKGKLIVPKELEIRCDNLEKLKNNNNNIINENEIKLNQLTNVNKQLTNDNEMKTNELNTLNNKINDLDNEKQDIIDSIEKIEKHNKTSKNDIEQINKETQDTKTKTGQARSDIEKTKEQISNEEREKDRLQDDMELLRKGALGKRISGFGKSIGKGIGGIMSTVSEDNAATATATQTSINNNNSISDQRVSRTTSIDPEVAHMNVGWIRQNAPRESLVDYQSKQLV